MSTIRTRSSIRKYKKDAIITDAQIKQLLDAAMHAPSAANSRPWEFLVVTNREKLDTIANVHPYAKMLTQTSAAIVVCAIPSVQQGFIEGFYPQDCGAAAQNILLEAKELGLGSCWIGVYPQTARVAEIREILNIEDSIVPICVIAIGEPDEEPKVRGFYDDSKVKYCK